MLSLLRSDTRGGTGNSGGLTAFTQNQKKRAGNENRAVGADDYAHNHNESKQVNAFTTKQVKHHNHKEDGERGPDRSAQGLVDGLVD